MNKRKCEKKKEKGKLYMKNVIFCLVSEINKIYKSYFIYLNKKTMLNDTFKNVCLHKNIYI